MRNLFVCVLIIASLFISPNVVSAKDDSTAIVSQQVNINTASAETLAAVLTGVGLSKAQAIVNYRKSNGKFEDPYDLVEVKGIGERIFVANEARIRLEN